MGRIYTKIGDIFFVKINESDKKYFQLIAFDLTQLNSDVIRVFNKIYPINTNPDLSIIVNDEIDFHAHCVTKLGLKMNLWWKIGNINKIGNIENVIFRDTNDYGKKIGEEPIKISHNWYIWKINDENFTRVGKLTGKNRKAEIGIIINPQSIVYRIRTGKYNFFYPDFE
jgi:hypothetical protein